MSQPQRFTAQPAAHFAPWVHSYWGIERDCSEAEEFTVYPDRFPELIFFDGPPVIQETAGRRRLPECTFIGVLTEPLRLELRGKVRCASIRFYAWAAHMLLRHPGKRSGPPWWDASALLAGWRPRVEQALKRHNWTAIPPLFDALLAELSASPPTAAQIAAARAFADQSPGRFGQRTNEIANRLGYSRRQVERQVQTVTQLTPKQLSSLTRFEFVRDSLWARPDVKLAELAIDAGYADQAHLTRDFKRFTGQTPAGFRNHCMRLRKMAKTGDVAFVQDPHRKKRQGVGYANQITND